MTTEPSDPTLKQQVEAIQNVAVSSSEEEQTQQASTSMQISEDETINEKDDYERIQIDLTYADICRRYLISDRDGEWVKLNAITQMGMCIHKY